MASANSDPLAVLPMDVERRMLLNDRATCLAQIRKDDLSLARRALGSLHPLLMGRIYFPEIMAQDTPGFHWEITDGFINNPRYAVGAPVGSAKTTTLTKLGSLWSGFYEDWNPETLIVSTSADMTSLWIDEMGRLCKNSAELHEDFPEFEGVHWGSSELEIVTMRKNGRIRNHFIRGIGVGGSTRGRRPGRIILDDPQDEAMVKSEKQRQDYHDWFFGALINRLNDPWRKLTYIGTCFDPDCFLVSLLNNPPMGWIARSYAILLPDGSSLWPGKYPIEFLRQRRSEIGEAKFQQEFQNNPVRNWNQRLFDPSRVQSLIRKIEPTDLVTACIDPAFRRGGDHWGVTVVAADRNGGWNALYAKKEQTGTEGWLAELATMANRFPQIQAVGIETGGGQAALEYPVQDYIRRHNIPLKAEIRWLKHSRLQGSKSSRIAQLAPIINQGRLTLAPGCEPLYREVESFRAGLDQQEDHLLDSLAMHLEVQRARKPYEAPVETPDDIRRKRMAGYRKMWDLARAAKGGQKSYWDRYV